MKGKNGLLRLRISRKIVSFKIYIEIIRIDSSIEAQYLISFRNTNRNSKRFCKEKNTPQNSESKLRIVFIS